MTSLSQWVFEEINIEHTPDLFGVFSGPREIIAKNRLIMSETNNQPRKESDPDRLSIGVAGIDAILKGDSSPTGVI